MATPFLNMNAQAGDPLQALLCKAAYWAMQVAGGTSSMAAIFPIMAPQAGDSLQTLAAKCAYWLASITGGSGAAVQTGAGAPVNGVTPNSPAIYFDTTGSSSYVYANGNWHAL
jgi:hypothetical protein